MRRLNTFIAAWLLTSALTPQVHAQSPAQVIGPVTPGDCPVFSSPTILKDGGFVCTGGAGGGPGVDANIVNVQGGDYTIDPSDCGKTIYLNSSSQHTLTAPSVSGFPTNCSVLIKHANTAAGVVLSGFSSELGGILYPGQSVGQKIVNGAWRTFYNPQPWAPVSAVTLFVSPSGNDANDGLTVSTPITLATACILRQTIFQPSSVTINLADGTYTTIASGSLCSIEGNSGGNSQALTNIVGNCTTPSNVVLSISDGNTGMFVKDLGEVEISCMKFQGSGSGVTIGISAAQFSVVDLSSTVWGSFGAGSIFVNVSQSSSLNLIGTAAMTLLGAPGANGTVIALASSANMTAQSVTIAIPSALAWGGQFFQMYGPTMATLASLTFTGSGVAGTTGKRASLIGNAYLVTGAVACNTFFPGNVGCTLVDGAHDDAGDNPTSVVPSGGASCTLTTVSHLTVVNGIVTLCN